MRKLLVGVAIVAAVVAWSPGVARATHECVPHQRTTWVDFAEGSTPFWQLFARPGITVAAASFIYPPRIRALGARTVYMDINFHRRIGGPTNPLSPAEVQDRALRLYDFASASMRCSRPWIALNELFGADIAPPWSPSYAQYRANVLLFMRTLAARGAHPFLLVSKSPWTGGEAADWWREAARYGDLVREVYFPAPYVHKLGAIRGNRYLRQYFRRGAGEFISIGIPPARIGLMLGFLTTPGRAFGGREGLQPASAWYEVVKWQALSARQVAGELGVGSVWSWGWEAYSAAERDPDKRGAACVWLWTRSPQLCNGPRAAGTRFNASLTDGQIDFARSIQCILDDRKLSTSTLARLARLTGDREAAYSALFERLVESGEVRVTTKDVLAAEQAIVQARFNRSAAAYRAALARAGANVAIARGVIGDELRRAAVSARFSVPTPSGADVDDYYASYESTRVREVEAKPAPWWLNGRKRGLALESSAPAAVFKLAAGKETPVWTPGGTIRVRPLGPPKPLSSVGLAAARPSIVAALRGLARVAKFDTWTVTRQTKASARARCKRDAIPQIDAVDLTDYLPFLELR